MKRRCYNKNAKDYLGDGFVVDESWKRDFMMFYNWAIQFWSNGHVLSRKDESIGFNPDNCYFRPKGEVSKNNANSNKAQQTCRKKYGTDTPLQNKDILLKTQRTNIKRYGGNSPACSPHIIQKIKETNLYKYGVDNPAKLESIKKLTKENNKKKYGVEYPQLLDEYKLKAKQRTIENNQAYFFNGKTSDILAQECDVSRSCMNARIRKYGYEQAIAIEKHYSEIECIMESILKEIDVEYIKQSKLEKYIPDFILPNLQIIIEVDGLYWHSDAVINNKYYHINKKNFYSKLGFKSLFFREDEINISKHIIKSIIINKINKSTKIGARKCILKSISKKDAKLFLHNNHLMGFGKGICHGLIYNNEIIAIMQIINKSSHLEISRFCTKINTNIVGGFSKILNTIIKIYNPKSISTFIDNRYGDGDYLYRLGFELINEDISFRWIKNNKTFHRMKFRGNSGYQYGMYKLWDCGQTKFIKIIS